VTKQRSSAGVTMLEVLIAGVILASIFSITWYLISSSADHVSREESRLSLETQAREALERFTTDLRQTRFTTVKDGSKNPVALFDNPDPKNSAHAPYFYKEILFRIPGHGNQSFDPVAFKSNPDMFLSRRITYRWQLAPGEIANGKDDNHDGLIDEGVIVRVEEDLDASGNPVAGTTKTSTLCRNIMEFRVNFPLLNQGQVNIAMSFELANRLKKGSESKEMVKNFTKTIESTCTIRN
jgi:type II secretory pathway pseudopilin PulG